MVGSRPRVGPSFAARLALPVVAAALSAMAPAGLAAQDLSPSNLTGPIGSAPGDSIRFDFSISNLGTVLPGTNWIGTLYLSTNNIISTGDTPVCSFSGVDQAPGTTSNYFFSNCVVPTSMANGAYYMGLILDVNNTVAETNEGNNAVASVGTIQICTDFGREPNGTLALATLIGGSTYSGFICGPRDEDWHRITVTAGNTLAAVVAPPSTQDYDIQILDAAGTVLASSALGTGSVDSAQYNVTASGTYYIRVFGFAGAHNPSTAYALRVYNLSPLSLSVSSYPPWDAVPTPTSVTRADSATVFLSGLNASTAGWSVTHRAAATWNTLTTSAGTGNGVVRWNRMTGSLAVGTYIDTFRVTAAGATGSPATFIDTLVIAPAAVSVANGVPVSGLSGAAGSYQFFTFTVPAGATNLSVGIDGGTGDADLYLNPLTLPTASLYSCRPFIGGNNELCPLVASPTTGTWYVMLKGFSSYSGVTLSVSYTTPLTLTVSRPSFIAWDGALSGATDVRNDSATVSLSGANASTTAWTATHKAAATWVTLTNSGATGSGLVRWQRNPTGLAAGTYVDTITVTASGAGGSPATILDTLVVANLAATLTSGTPVSNIAGAAGSAMYYRITVPSGVTQLQVNTSGGSGDADLFVRFGAAPSRTVWQCASGSFTTTESCTVNAPAAGDWYILIHGFSAYSGMSLTATASQGLTLAASRVASSGWDAAPTGVSDDRPDSAAVTLSGTNAGSTAWAAAHTAAATWLTLTTAGGTGSGTVRWMRNPAGLTAGIYVDTITISASGAAGSPVRIVDTLVLASVTSLTSGVSSAVANLPTGGAQYFHLIVPAGATAVTFSMAGGTGAAQLLVATSTWSTTIVAACTSSAAQPSCVINNPVAGNWYGLVRAVGGLSNWTITGTVTQTATVTLAVSPAATWHATPQNITANGTDSATVTLSGTGASSVPWTASHTAAATWITLGSAGGTGSGMATWTRNSSGLAAGTYVDTITVTAGGASGSPARVVDTLVVTASATVLSSGVPVTNLNGAAGGAQYFQVTYPVGATQLSVTTSGGTGDVSLGVLFLSHVVAYQSFCVQQTIGSNVETCTISTPGGVSVAFPVYIVLRGVAAYSGVSLTATASSPLALALSTSVRRDTVTAGTTASRADSAAVTLAGTGASGAVWAASHRAAATWNTFTTAGGTGSGMLRWTRNPTGLAAGVYVDSILVTSSGAQGSPALLLDSLVVTSALTLAVQPASRFVAVANGTTGTITDSTTVTLGGFGAGTTHWSATHRAAAAWVTLTADSGTGSGKLRYARAVTGLAPGTYLDSIIVTAVGAAGSPALFVDSLIVTPSLSLALTPSRWTGTLAGTGVASAPVVAAVTLAGSGAGGATWAATHRAAATWNTPTNAGGTGSGQLSWTRNKSGLAAGIYVDTFTVTVTGATGSPARLIDTVVVAASATVLTNGTAMTNLSGAQGSAAFYSLVVPAGQTLVTVTTSGGTGSLTLLVASASANRAAGFSCAPSALNTAATCQLAPALQADTLLVVLKGEAGGYNGVSLTGSYVAQVALSVGAANRRDTLTAGSFTTRGDSVDVTLLGTNSSSTGWNAVHTAAATWLTLTTANGTGSGRARWTRSAAGLAAGTYVDTLTITASALNSPARVIDTLIVYTPATLSLFLNVASRRDSVVAPATGTRADSASVSLSGPNATTTGWTATHRAAATWITLTTAAGTGSGRVRWTRAYAGLAGGTYIDTITVTAVGAAGSPRRVVDTLIVASVTLATTPAARRDSTYVGLTGTRADSAAVTITGPGATTTAWTATHRAAATWVTVTTPGGTGSGQVRWTRNYAGLAQGTFVDTITVTVANATGSPSRIVDTLVVLAVPVGSTAGIADAILGGTLTSQQQFFLDQAGNKNGSFDLGDFLAWYSTHPTGLSQERLAQIMDSLVRGSAARPDTGGRRGAERPRRGERP